MKKMRAFIGCLPGNADEGELKELLSKYVQIANLKLSFGKNKNDENYCLGYGFAQCNAQEDIQKLLNLSNTIIYNGRSISFREFKVGSKLKSQKDDFNKKRIFVGGLPPEIDSEGLKALFAAYGKIENCYIVNKERDNAMKYGYVVFSETSSADSVLENSENIYCSGMQLRIEPFQGKGASSHEQDSVSSMLSGSKSGKAKEPKKPGSHSGSVSSGTEKKNKIGALHPTIEEIRPPMPVITERVSWPGRQPRSDNPTNMQERKEGEKSPNKSREVVLVSHVGIIEKTEKGEKASFKIEELGAHHYLKHPVVFPDTLLNKTNNNHHSLNLKFNKRFIPLQSSSFRRSPT